MVLCNSNRSLTWVLAVLVSLSVTPEISLVNANKSKGCKKHSSKATEKSSNTAGLGYGLGPGDSIEFTREVPDTQELTHRLTLPNDYDPMGAPPPLMLFFHGWGGNYEECGDHCLVDAPEKGFVSVSMTGYGNTGWSSWNFPGGSSSPGPDGATCEEGAAGGGAGYCPDYGESQGCDCSQADNCWWTTCYDSVAQVLSILDEVQDEICIDLDRVWAVGVSNGGMFTFDLASDHRSAPRLAGIVPITGLPNNGYSTGPFAAGMSMFGMLGVSDTTVPPISNTDDPNKTLDTINGVNSGSGWYYTSLKKVMMDWTKESGCEGEGQDSLIDDYGVSSYEGLTCTQGCSERKDSTHVVACLFEGGHQDSDLDEIWEPAFNFMLTPRKQPSTSPSTSPSASPIASPSASPIKSPSKACVEKRFAKYVFTKPNDRRNGKVRMCANLAKMPDTKKNEICSQTGPSVNDVGVASDMCRITCETCPKNSCIEHYRDKISFTVNGRSFEKNCHWLQKRVKRGTNTEPFWTNHFSINKMCRNATQNCRVTCGKCDNLV